MQFGGKLSLQNERCLEADYYNGLVQRFRSEKLTRTWSFTQEFTLRNELFPEILLKEDTAVLNIIWKNGN